MIISFDNFSYVMNADLGLLEGVFGIQVILIHKLKQISQLFLIYLGIFNEYLVNGEII